MKHIVLKQLELRKIIKRVRPDLVHLNNTYAANHEWMLACRLNNIRIVAHDRGTRPPSTWQTRVFIRFLEATISVSEAYKNIVIEQGLKPKRIRRVYNGLDAEKLKKYRSIQDRRKVRESLGINENTILVGMVGNIDYWKGQLVFIKAMDILVKENRDIHGVIIGKTAIGAESYEQEIQQFLNDKKITGKVNLLGFRQDIPQLLNAMDIFVHASVEPEPFGRVILEAMAMAKPIVATKSGGTLEQIEHEHSGLLVPMGDHQSMANAIKKYTTDMKWANSIGDNALERLNGFFSIANMVKGVEDVYEEIFDSRK
jgi:glycosyltransferase involved in cell wall biosynthesis